MPEIVKPYLGQSSSLKNFEKIISQIGWVSRGSHRRREDQFVILPAITSESPLENLLLVMFSKLLQDVLAQQYWTFSRAGLGFFEPLAFTCSTLGLTLNIQHP
jgi:hypothetical protein